MPTPIAQQRKRFCFVIMPFSAFDNVRVTIEQAAQEAGLEFRRADTIYKPGVVMSQIRRDIEEADVVIADLSEALNSNVFYETGMAHVLKAEHQVILIARRKTSVPFDLALNRYLEYDADDFGMKQLRKVLVPAIESARRGPVGRLMEQLDGRELRPPCTNGYR